MGYEMELFMWRSSLRRNFLTRNKAIADTFLISFNNDELPLGVICLCVYGDYTWQNVLGELLC